MLIRYAWQGLYLSICLSTSSDAMLLEDVPVKHSIVFEGLSLEQIAEYSLQKSDNKFKTSWYYRYINLQLRVLPVVRSVLEAQREAVSEVVSEFRRVALAKLVRMCDLIVEQK